MDSSSPQLHPPMASPLSNNEQSIVIASESNQTSPPKKSLPIPWTHEETLGIIKAYQEKWYSLNKGQLKAFQWDEVAAAFASTCGFGELSKTSTQCRHKIEKLRKRYRSEIQKPYPESWQYFSLMDQMERGPIALITRPVKVLKPSSTTSNHIHNHNNYGISSNLNSMRPSRHRTDSRGSNWGGGFDESDEEWSVNGSGKRSRSKSINNIVRDNSMNGVRNAKRVAMERGFSGNGIYLKSNQIYATEYSDGDDDDDDDDVDDEDEEENVGVEEDVDGRVLAEGIKGFAERFVRSESKKIEMMRETERYRMEMEKKRMDMILVAQRKIIEMIGSAFGKY